MASKLLAQIMAVDKLVNQMTDAAMEFLKHRIEHGTLVESVIPKAQRKGQELGRDAATWIATAMDSKKKLENTEKWIDKFAADLAAEIVKLEKQLAAYDPGAMKKPQLMDDARITARERLKAHGLKLVDEAKDGIKEVRKMVVA